MYQSADEGTGVVVVSPGVIKDVNGQWTPVTGMMIESADSDRWYWSLREVLEPSEYWSDDVEC